MNANIIIQAADKTQVPDIVKIYNEAFLPKFRFISNDEGLMQSFLVDFRAINTDVEDQEFVAREKEKILGILSLRFKGQNKTREKLPWASLVKKYGVSGIIRSFLFTIILTHNPGRDELYIDSIAVSSDDRGRGIGTMLLEKAEELAEKRGLGFLSLQVMEENSRAIALYKRCGYTIMSSRKVRILESAGYRRAILMMKDLQKNTKGVER